MKMVKRKFLLKAQALRTEEVPRAHLPAFQSAQNAPADLGASEMRYRRLFETARDGVLLLNPDTRKITDVNPFMTQFLGYTHAEFVGKELWEIGLAEDRADSRKMFRALRRTHFVRYENLPLVSSTGQARPVEVVANLYEENTHQVIQCNVRDIAARKRDEQALVAAKNESCRQASELQKTVTERTARLWETIAELEAFSYSISHDMRAPLRAMRGFAEILLEEHSAQLDLKALNYLEKIAAGAAHLDSLIMEVLTYTHVLNAEVKLEAIDLNVLVPQVIKTYPELQNDNVEIQIEGPLPKVLGGGASVAQCVSSLLTNAVKFVPPKTKARVKIRAEAVETDIRLWVEDNGVGIAPQDQSRIFKMFERVGRAATYEGFGMGLTIARKAVERMGGQIGVESTVGQGSKFWIQLKEATL
ncbi:MAG TPA: ATP-binding protein [Candidatus Saccharimonadales bacterium]|nr:ATP-binding protein [Candidatus Saccharimonadales bacterium]